MILKLKRDAGWTYLDQIEGFQTFGYIERPAQGDGENALHVQFFDSVGELSPCVDRTWGDHREFDREVWPTFPLGLKGSMVESGVARLTGGRDVLVLWNDEAFLLSEEGHTIDRLR